MKKSKIKKLKWSIETDGNDYNTTINVGVTPDGEKEAKEIINILLFGIRSSLEGALLDKTSVETLYEKETERYKLLEGHSYVSNHKNSYETFGYYIELPNKIPNGKEIFKDDKYFIYREEDGKPATLAFKFYSNDIEELKLGEGRVH